MCCVVAVLTLLIVRHFIVCMLPGVSLRDVQGGVTEISGTGTLSAEHCTFSQNTAKVSPAVRALLRVMSQYP